jgi:glycosyltransferase involved in cell wall biosynthesis
MAIRPDLSVIIPALHEGPNLALLLPLLRRVLEGLEIRFEVLIVTRGPDPQTQEVAAQVGAGSIFVTLLVGKKLISAPWTTHLAPRHSSASLQRGGPPGR